MEESEGHKEKKQDWANGLGVIENQLGSCGCLFQLEMREGEALDPIAAVQYLVTTVATCLTVTEKGKWCAGS